LPLIGGGLLAAALGLGGLLFYRSRDDDPGRPTSWGGGAGGPGAPTETLGVDSDQNDAGGRTLGAGSRSDVGGGPDASAAPGDGSDGADDEMAGASAGPGDEGRESGESEADDGPGTPDVDPMGGLSQPRTPYPDAEDEDGESDADSGNGANSES